MLKVFVQDEPFNILIGDKGLPLQIFTASVEFIFFLSVLQNYTGIYLPTISFH